jgi:hypothetical protein
MNENLQEFVSAGAGCRVDRQAAVLHNVKIIGVESKNGRRYLPEGLRRAIPLYENCKVFLDHPRGGAPVRSYADRLGSLRNVRVEQGDGGLRGDFHFNPKHPVSEQLLWDAEHAPENVGFSHNVEARTSKKDGKVVVEEIIRVASVDLVADPATTRGLFEHTENGGDAAKQELVAQVAAEVGLAPWAIPALDGGLRYRESREEIADYLRSIKSVVGEAARAKLGTVDRFAVSGDKQAAEDFAAIVADRPSPREQGEFRQAMGLPSRNGEGKAFADAIT